MKYMNRICADAGTANCPCPLAETGNCLICSRLAGKEKCDCSWCGLCIYNEFVQGGGVVRNMRNNIKAPIAEKKQYDSDLLVITVKVDKGLALSAAEPGSFVFLNGTDKEFFSVPVSVMKTDVQKGQLSFAIKVLSAKTQAIAEAEDFVFLRGIYRNGLLGGEISAEELRPGKGCKKRWLIMTKGVGLAPAVNLLEKLCGKATVDMVIDTEKITEEFVDDSLRLHVGASEDVSIALGSLADAAPLGDGRLRLDAKVYDAAGYDRVVILASDYYIGRIAEHLELPDGKLIFSNNFHMCCGEGICGACSHIDEDGNVNKMCKCRQADVKSLL